MPKSIQIIQDRVTQHLTQGATIDVYRLAELLQEHCTDLSLNEIAAKIGEAVVQHGGSAFWEGRNSPSAQTGLNPNTEDGGL
jgi:hypothetical protein